MDPGPLPQGLPVLTTVEEMLIARVHVFMEVHQVRGQQYKYSGHVCNFLRDVGKIYTKHHCFLKMSRLYVFDQLILNIILASSVNSRMTIRYDAKL